MADAADISDEELVELAQAELPYNTRSLESLLRRHEELILRTCRRYLADDTEADDATQEVFLRVFHGVKKFRGDATFRTWLYTIVSNVCATRYAKRKRREEKLAAFQESTGRDLRRQEAVKPVQSTPMAEAMEEMNEDDRNILMLRHVADLTVPEIAEVQGIELSAAKMRISRAQKRLKAVYQRISEKPKKE